MTTDCMRSGLSPRLCAIDGSAVLTMVESSVCMKKPTATTHSMMRRSRSWGMEGGMGLHGCQSKTPP
ncbi:hypothetical protein D3C81_992540 [compost metagenome]